MNKTNCTSGSLLTPKINKNKIKPQIASASTSGSYITTINFYLHPNTQTSQTHVGSHAGSNSTTGSHVNTVSGGSGSGSGKPKCSNKDCHYYDPCCDEYYLCCNPVCMYFDPYYFDPYFYPYI